MMLSRCNFHAITLANARFNTFGLHRSFALCLAQKSVTAYRRSKQKQPWCLGHARDSCQNLRLSRFYSHNGRPPSAAPPPVIDDDTSQSIFQRFKNMAKKYWYVVLPVHLVTSTLWFGSFYFIASSGVNIPALMESLGFPEWIIDKVRDGNSWTSYLVIAYGLYKIFTPLRYMVTLGGTGMTIRYLRRLGYAIGDSSCPKKP